MIDTINLLRQNGAKKKSIQRYIVEHSSLSPTLKDIANLIVKLKKREKGSKAPVELLHERMRELCEKEPGNVGRVFTDVVDSKAVATCITLPTKHMHEMLVKFPEVLLIDATHGTKASRYKVFSFMAHDVFGKGQYVQHAILQSERSETIQNAIETSKTNNPYWKRVQCVIIDKDFKQMKVLRVSMPQACILLCQFHVIKWLWEEIAGDRYRFTLWKKDRLRSVVKLMVYARTQREYEALPEYMRHMLKLAPDRDCNATNWTDKDDNTFCTATNQGMGADYSFFEHYFVKNWESCRKQCCSYTRQNSITLGNNTNNRLEASSKHLKETVDAFMTVDDCIACIMYYQSMLDKEYYARLYNLSVARNASYDAEMERVLNLVSGNVFNLIYEEYIFAITSAN
uniref:Uncharacterized protein AlNc14C222G9130 n=1 Tax=Albugo laibachii Nc14 TaxID=890382 RepID=F0WRY7_9STRA|nr:hypothetical protein PITG_23301 [Albugo laibachii Nc14]|eukprot:CCA24104.1 hypothetical protein PITG_23301 [Albugo laibachii Nc14]